MTRMTPALMIAFSLVLAQPVTLLAEETKPPAAETAAPAPPTSAPPTAAGEAKVEPVKAEPELTAEEKTEKEARKACKIDICAAFRNPTAPGSDISCPVNKSWRKEQLVKMVARLKVTWPYGAVRCTSAVKLKRDELVKAMSDGKHTSQLEKHAVTCSVDREKDPASEIKFEFTPKVDFEKGKAIAARMNWGKIEAPTLIKGALWTATAADNTVNMLSGSLVEDINDFIGKKCDEVKDDWSARK
ncbi:MAG: hypothetical protein ABL907_00085 [Hyphomicrobium sp.]